MARMWMLGIALVLSLALTGAVAGYILAPRYRAPAGDGEPRLRERAAEYYHAIQLRDHYTMGKMYTPARQLAEHEQLLIMAEEQARMFQNFKPETRATFEATAASIEAAELGVELEGDWAVTMGRATTVAGGVDVPIGLGEVVWVRTGGDWWVCTMTYDELNAYGNPPDFARDILKRQSKLGIDPASVVIEFDTEDTAGGAESDASEAGDVEEPGEPEQGGAGE